MRKYSIHLITLRAQHSPDDIVYTRWLQEHAVPSSPMSGAVYCVSTEEVCTKGRLSEVDDCLVCAHYMLQCVAGGFPPHEPSFSPPINERQSRMGSHARVEIGRSIV